MKDLIEALTILLKYLKDPNVDFPTNCNHDEFVVCDVDFTNMTIEDARRLYSLGFFFGCDDDYCEDIPEVSEDSSDNEFKKLIDYAREYLDCMASFRFGSC